MSKVSKIKNTFIQNLNNYIQKCHFCNTEVVFEKILPQEAKVISSGGKYEMRFRLGSQTFRLKKGVVHNTNWKSRSLSTVVSACRNCSNLKNCGEKDRTIIKKCVSCESNALHGNKRCQKCFIKTRREAAKINPNIKPDLREIPIPEIKNTQDIVSFVHEHLFNSVRWTLGKECVYSINFKLKAYLAGKEVIFKLIDVFTGNVHLTHVLDLENFDIIGLKKMSGHVNKIINFSQN